VEAFTLNDHRRFDGEGDLEVDSAGWLLLRAWNDGADPGVLDLYPYATTSPVYLDLPGGGGREGIAVDRDGTVYLAKTGAGAALVTYLSGSNKAFDATYPQSSLNGASRRITYKRTYAAGEATTASAITEAVIVNETIATDATSTAANTISRILVTGISAKGASDTLTATWNHDLLGA